jgi:RimJ/RimL family protein N-acetyltransferase
MRVSRSEPATGAAPAPAETSSRWVLETPRLRLREFNAGDAAFALELVNEPAWIRFIGDRQVRTLDDARRYLENGPIAMYPRIGFGLYLVALKASGEPIGMCGLIKRDTLPDVDVGFAFLSRFQGKGYAREAASAVIAWGRARFALSRIVAILSRDNEPSVRLLRKLGFEREGTVRIAGDDDLLELYASAH